MDSSIVLQEMFKYPAWPIVLMVLSLLGIAGYIWYRYIRKPKEKPVKPVEKPVVTDIGVGLKIKVKYLERIEAYEADYNNNKISMRELYQHISMCIREFVTEMTGVDTTTYTLSDIRKLQIPALTGLIESYYRPEFSKDVDRTEEDARENSEKLLTKTLKKTKAFITKWN